MTKFTLLAAAALMSFGAAAITPAFAGEGNGDPFPATSFSTTRLPHQVARDVGQNQYPDVVGRAGSNLTTLANDQALPAPGNNQPVQSANSLPRGFEDGTVTYAQAMSVQNWMVAHNQASPASFAAR
jgi:hypothetical protein